MSIQNLSGQMLGQYELRDLIGVGGMGAVYRGYQVNLKREVAIKVLSPQLAQQAGYIERFNREAETAAALEHRHIIPIHDYGTQRGISYVVMRMLTGGTLSDRLALYTEENKPLPSLGEISKVLEQLASALDYAHSQGVIHRDIKPSNVMFDNQGSAYLVDFGIAKLIEATQALTGTGTTMGTPAYMSPEQWKAEALTRATDQYALGVMVYTLVTGRVPFEAPTPYALMNKHLYEQPTPPQVVRPDVPQAVNDVIERAMAKNASDRFPTCTAFAQAFDRAIRGQTGEMTNFFTTPVKPRPVMAAPSGAFTPGGTGHPVHRQPLVWVMGLALLVMAAVIGFLVFGGGDNNKATPTPVAIGATATATPEASATSENTPTLTGTATLEPTQPILAVFTPTPTPSHTPTLTLTPVPTDTLTPTDTPTLTETPDFEKTMNAEFSARLTETATGWTMTPTSTVTPTITNTPTFTETPTLAPTFTQTPTAPPSPTITPAPAHVVAVVQMPQADVRAAPASGQTLGTVTAGDRLTVTGVTGSLLYYRVDYQGQTGWIFHSYVTIGGDVTTLPVVEAAAAPPETARVVAVVQMPQADVRAAPASGQTLGTVSAGDRLDVTGVTGSQLYYRVDYRGQTGWIFHSYVTIEGDVTTLPVVEATAAPPLTAQVVAVVQMPQADVRAAPASGQTLGTVTAGDRLTVTGVTGSQLYYRVDYQSQSGWIFHSYVTIEGNPDNVPVVEP